MAQDPPVERQQFNLFLNKEIIRALKLRCIHEDRRLNHFVEAIFTRFLASPPSPASGATAPASSQIMKTLLPTIIVGVDDMARSVHLYRDLMGLPCRTQGNRWTEFDVGGHTLALHIQDAGGAAKANGVVVLCIEVADLDATVGRLREAGYAVKGPAEMEGLGLLASFRDPDDVSISLSQARPD